MMKMHKMNLEKFHPSKIFGEKWIDYAADIKKASKADEFFDVVSEIAEKYSVTIGDALVVFARVLFSEKTFYQILIKRDATMLYDVFEILQTNKQE